MQYQFIRTINITVVSCIFIFISGCVEHANDLSSETSINSYLSSEAPIGGLTVAQINADVSSQDADGVTISSSTSDASAQYMTLIPETSAYPLLITSDGGLDLVTGAPSSYPMISAVMSQNETTANFTPFSVLIIKAAQLMNGGLTADNLQTANRFVLKQFNFGLNTNLVANPITTPITEDNIAEITRASVALSEMIRRVQVALQSMGVILTPDELFNTLAADVVDGMLDGNGAEGTDSYVSIVANVISAQVLVEMLDISLNIGVMQATGMIDNAIRIMSPGATKSTGDIGITEELLFQVMTTLAVAQSIAPSLDLSALSMAIGGLTPETSAADVATILSTIQSASLNEVIAKLQNITQEDIDKAVKTVRYMAQERDWGNTLSLAWAPNLDDIKGYIVYYGPTPETATNVISDMPATSVQIDMEKDLKLTKGENVCFRLSAYNAQGQSEASEAACITY